MSRINEEQWGEFLAELNARNAAVPPPATPQEPTGAQLALADIEKAYAETEVALAQVVSRNDKELFFNGDKALRAHLQKNLDYYRIRRDGVRALLASAAPAVGQPIETAPKDGTPVLLLWFDAETGAAPMHRVGFWHSREQAWCDTHRVLHNQHSHPTHWMPIPSPPTPGEHR